MYILLRYPGTLARRERQACRGMRAAAQPAYLGTAARRGAAAGGHLLRCRSSTMFFSGIACVAAPRICPPGVRAKMYMLFLRRPLGLRPSAFCNGFSYLLFSPSCICMHRFIAGVTSPKTANIDSMRSSPVECWTSRFRMG